MKLRNLASALILAGTLVFSFAAFALENPKGKNPVSFEACNDPEQLPENLLLGYKDLQFEEMRSVVNPEVPAVRISGGLLFEALFLLSLVVGLTYWIWLGSSHRSRSKAPLPGRYGAQRRSTHSFQLNLPLAVTSLFLVLALLADHSWRAYKVRPIVDQVTKGIEEGNFDRTIERLKALRVVLAESWFGRLTPWDSTFEKIDFIPLHDALGIRAINHALQTQDLSRLSVLASSFEPFERDAVTASNSAHSAIALAQIEQGDVESAYKLVLKGWLLDQSREEMRQNLCVARYHLARELVAKSQPHEALKQLTRIDDQSCEIEAFDRSVLRGAIARGIAEQALAANPADPPMAVSSTREAHEYMLARNQEISFITCDYAATLEPLSVMYIAKDQPDKAVAALDLSDSLVPERDFVRTALPRALLALGTKSLAEQKFQLAIDALERGHRLNQGDQEIFDMLVLSNFSSGSAAAEAKDWELAIRRIGRAHDLAPSNQEITLAFADTYLARGDELMQHQRTIEAGEDFMRASTLTSKRRRHAQMRLALMEGTQSRFSAIASSSSFLSAPSFQGEKPFDPNNDGYLDGVLLFQVGRETPAAIMHLGNQGLPSEVLMMNEDKEVVTAFRDNDSNGELDERLDYAENQLTRLVLDSDADTLPDIRIDYGEYGRRVSHLSGSVLMRFKSGVIGAQVDPFNSADAFIKVFRNYSFVGRTETVVDTQFPSWRKGVVVDYRFGDDLKLEIWDEDLFFDDLVDTFVFSRYPTSGIVQATNRKVGLEIIVRPTDLPHGYVLWSDAPDVDQNIFRDNPTAVPSAAHLVSGAHHARKQAAFNREVAKWVVMNALVPRLLPTKDPLTRYLRDLVLENAIVDPAFGGDKDEISQREPS